MLFLKKKKRKKKKRQAPARSCRSQPTGEEGEKQRGALCSKINAHFGFIFQKHQYFLQMRWNPVFFFHRLTNRFSGELLAQFPTNLLTKLERKSHWEFLMCSYPKVFSTAHIILTPVHCKTLQCASCFPIHSHLKVTMTCEVRDSAMENFGKDMWDWMWQGQGDSEEEPGSATRIRGLRHCWFPKGNRNLVIKIESSPFIKEFICTRG